MAPRPCSRIDGGVVGVAPKGVVGADVVLIGNNPWKLLMKLTFPRSIPEILFSPPGCCSNIWCGLRGCSAGEGNEYSLSFITPMSWP